MALVRYSRWQEKENTHLVKSPITSTIIYILFSPVTIAIAFGFFLKNLSISLNEHLIPFSRNYTYFLRSSLNWFAFEEVMLTVGLLLNCTLPDPASFLVSPSLRDSSSTFCLELPSNAASVPLLACCKCECLIKCDVKSWPKITENYVNEVSI